MMKKKGRSWRMVCADHGAGLIPGKEGGKGTMLGNQGLTQPKNVSVRPGGSLGMKSLIPGSLENQRTRSASVSLVHSSPSCNQALEAHPQHERTWWQIQGTTTRPPTDEAHTTPPQIWVAQHHDCHRFLAHLCKIYSLTLTSSRTLCVISRNFISLFLKSARSFVLTSWLFCMDSIPLFIPLPNKKKLLCSLRLLYYLKFLEVLLFCLLCLLIFTQDISFPYVF